MDDHCTPGVNLGAIMDLRGWLRSLGLEEYEAIFRDNAIDETVLPDLTDQDLEKLGVLLGHRRRLLRAIANFEPAKSVSAIPAAAVPPSAVVAQDTAERRQVTVMFSDLVGSTALSARMDPEDLREVIAAYHKCVAEIVRRFEGFVAKYLGDGVLVYFGYPQAHEDDAERAVRSGLELIAAVCALKTRALLQARVGIATGLVVVGDLLDAGRGTRARHHRGNAKSRCAPAGNCPAKYGCHRRGYEKTSRQSFRASATSGRVNSRGWRGWCGPGVVVRASSVESRFEALHTTGVATLVGRDEEVELLMRRWKQVKTGEGRVVLISGEPGIGKSRLTTGLSEHIGTESHTRLRYFCAPHYQDSALYPFIVQLERAAGFTRDDRSRPSSANSGRCWCRACEMTTISRC